MNTTDDPELLVEMAYYYLWGFCECNNMRAQSLTYLRVLYNRARRDARREKRERKETETLG